MKILFCKTWNIVKSVPAKMFLFLLPSTIFFLTNCQFLQTMLRHHGSLQTMLAPKERIEQLLVLSAPLSLNCIHWQSCLYHVPFRFIFASICIATEGTIITSHLDTLKLWPNWRHKIQPEWWWRVVTNKRKVSSWKVKVQFSNLLSSNAL